MAPVTVKVPSSQTRVVALSFGKRTQHLASGRKLSSVNAKAKKANASATPVFFFVPKKNAVHVF